MKKSVFLIFFCVAVATAAQAQKEPTGAADRMFWLAHLDKLARPVLTDLAKDELKQNMPVLLSKRSDNPATRKTAAYLEAFGRLLSGMGPWLNLEGGSAKEQALRTVYRKLVLQSISHAVNPAAKDYMEWHAGGQPLVDASFMALGFLRCPWLWEHLADTTRRQVADAFLLTRQVKPPNNNWILFSAMIEIFFLKYGYAWERARVDSALQKMEGWYAGDGVYADGPKFHWDYYNSYVIHPYLEQLLETLNEKTDGYRELTEKIKKRSERYAVIQERLINADGSFPATGRSVVYRGGAFHHLADVAWKRRLPAALTPAQVRCALTAVLKKTTEHPATFTKEGWLSIGLYGAQPDIADVYNNTGSLYLCSAILLPLGLPDTDPFWSAPAAWWTAKKLWNGLDVPNDHAVD